MGTNLRPPHFAHAKRKPARCRVIMRGWRDICLDWPPTKLAQTMGAEEAVCSVHRFG